jgi:hypothetical protein
MTNRVVASVGQTVRNRAIVIGGSIAGLAAARVLSDHFREVILVERDRFGAVGEHRRGVPQGRHTHGLLAGGLRVLEGFFPGLFEEAQRAGGLGVDPAPPAKREHPGVFNDRFARSRSLLHFTACRVLGDPERAELAVRNCWRRASRNPPGFRHDGAFRSWLVRLLIDEALAILHRPGSQECAMPTFMNASS